MPTCMHNMPSCISTIYHHTCTTCHISAFAVCQHAYTIYNIFIMHAQYILMQNMPLCVTPMHMQLVISYILIHDRVLVSSPVQNFDFRFRCSRFRSRFRSRVSRLQLLITTTPKTARCCRKRVMDIPAKPEVSCLSCTYYTRH